MDLTTAIQQVLRELHIDTTVSDAQSENDCKKAIIDAMQFFEIEVFWFLRRRHRINLQNGVFEYALPDDFEGITSDVFYIPDNTDQTIKWPLKWAPGNYIHSLLSTGTEWETSINHGDPKFYTVDPSSWQIILAPRPDKDTTSLDFEYALRSDIPQYKYTGGAWTFYAPDSFITLPSDFTNVWLREAYHMIIYRASQQLLTGLYGGSEESLSKASEFEKKYAQEMNKLRAKHTRLVSPLSIRKHM